MLIRFLCVRARVCVSKRARMHVEVNTNKTIPPLRSLFTLIGEAKISN